MSEARPVERFQTRWGLIASLLGMAIGAGNIWRFPRVAAANGGGAFLIPWALFLFLWSVPLMLVEFAMGRHTRRGPIGAFGALWGGRMGVVSGLFVAFCTSAILFYYAVVTGWCAYYTLRLALDFGTVSANATAVWSNLSHGSGVGLAFHALAVGLGAWIVGRGVAGGLERVNRVLIPVLFLLLGVAAVAGLSLPGGQQGLVYLFHVDWHKLGQHRTWIEALSQSAWSTGAGWGLILTYAVYARRDEDLLLNSLVAGVGNNAASLLAALAILPAVFALAAPGEAGEALSGNTGLLFVWMPRLFSQMSGGHLLAVVFFLAVTVAALSSLLAMLEMATRVVMDFGVARRRAVLGVAGVSLLAGAPSAWNLAVFENQDWVWGLGLLVSGGFFTVTVLRYGAGRFRRRLLVVAPGGWSTGRWFDVLLWAVVPVEFLVLLGWWSWATIRGAKSPADWMSPFSRYSLGTCLLQWGVVIAAGLLGAGWIGRRLSSAAAQGQSASDGRGTDPGEAP